MGLLSIVGVRRICVLKWNLDSGLYHRTLQFYSAPQSSCLVQALAFLVAMEQDKPSMSTEQDTTPTPNFSDGRLQFILNRSQTNPHQLVYEIGQLHAERDHFFGAAYIPAPGIPPPQPAPPALNPSLVTSILATVSAASSQPPAPIIQPAPSAPLALQDPRATRSEISPIFLNTTLAWPN